jgi:hypothetical protein
VVRVSSIYLEDSRFKPQSGYFLNMPTCYPSFAEVPLGYVYNNKGMEKVIEKEMIEADKIIEPKLQDLWLD